MFITFSRVNRFLAKDEHIRPFGAIRWKLPQKNEKILCNLLEQWRVGKLKSSTFQNAILRKLGNFCLKTQPSDTWPPIWLLCILDFIGKIVILDNVK